MPLFPGFDTLGTLEHIMKTGYDYSWFVLTQKIIEREFALSGSEQNPDLTGEQLGSRCSARAGRRRAATGRAFKEKGADFIVERNLGDLVARMNELAGAELIDAAALEREIAARDREIDNAYTKDAQITAIRGARNYLGDKLIRVAKPHRLLDPDAGPLIAVRLWILTRKTLGGLRDRSVRARARGRRSAARQRVRRRRGRRLRRRRHARLPRARGHVSRRLHLLGPHRGTGGGESLSCNGAGRGWPRPPFPQTCPIPATNPDQHHARNGLVWRSSPRVLMGPWPQMKTTSSPSGRSLVLMAAISAAWSP